MDNNRKEKKVLRIFSRESHGAKRRKQKSGQPFVGLTALCILFSVVGTGIEPVCHA